MPGVKRGTVTEPFDPDGDRVYFPAVIFLSDISLSFLHPVEAPYRYHRYRHRQSVTVA